jgi:hypothetical protein
MSTGNTIPAQTCEDCGLRSTGSAYHPHRNAYPPDHPLRRCADPMEMQALGYKRRRSDGAYTADLTTDASPSSARQLATCVGSTGPTLRFFDGACQSTNALG